MTIDIDILRAATDRIFAHRKLLRDKAVRIGFWPDGLRISVGLSLEVIAWEKLPRLTRDELISIVDRVAGATELNKLLSRREQAP